MLSGATAPEQVPELQLSANLAIEEGAPPLSYWEGLYVQLKKNGCELDFPAIEERVFSCLVLGPKAMNQAEGGRLLHDISTEVFGRAYLEVRAGYFTH
jgi:hypothetical protein